MAVQDTYKEVVTHVFPNAIVRVHIPDITEEERAKRMKVIHDAAARLLLSLEEQKQRQPSN